MRNIRSSVAGFGGMASRRRSPALSVGGAPIVLATALLGVGALAGTSSAALPDGRVYEKVSPAGKSDQGALSDHAASSPLGNTIAFTAFSAFGDSQVGSLPSQYVATRGPDGWHLRSVLLKAGPASDRLTLPLVQKISSDATKFVVAGSVAGLPGAPPGVANLYVRDMHDDAAHLVTTVAPSLPPPGYTPVFGAVSADFGHVAFLAGEALVPGAISGHSNIYRWDDGQLSLASILPGGQPAADGAVVAPSGAQPGRRAMSADGSRLFFAAGPGVDSSTLPSPLYMREGVTTTLISASQRMPAAPGGDAALFRTASVDGSKAFFTDGEQLTNDSTADGSNPDLYRYDADNGVLTDVTPAAGGAGVQGLIGEASDDGSYIYFVASAQLDGTLGTPGAPNLYVWHDGDPIRFIATLDGSDGFQWSMEYLHQPARAVTPDGRHLIFTSILPLTGYDSAGFVEVYRYDATQHRLACVSCDPDLSPATGSAVLVSDSPAGVIAQSRRVSTDDGSRVFFNSPDALVGDDTNGTQDVYEWEDGALHLISDGMSDEPADFADASSDGNDVFFTTRAHLTSDDTDALADLYDARVGGGLPQPAAPQPCSADACQGPMTTPPPVPNVASIDLTGRGNLATERPAPVRVKASKVKAIRGTKGSLKLTVSAGGRLSWSGRGLAGGRRTLSKAQTSTVTFSLSRSAAKTLAAKHRYTTSLRLTFTPKAGRVVTTIVPLTFRSKATARRAK